jgi:threonine dehydratase
MTPSAPADQSGSTPLPTLADVLAARELLDGVIDPTPVAPGRALSDLVGGPVHLKCENLQRTGSFKVRGAYVRLARLTEDERARGVVAASAGNHAQGVALAAALLGIRATVFMPQNASLPKVTATTAYGAHVHSVDGAVEQALVAAEEFAATTGAVMIHPFDHPDVVAGQGTVGLEILEQVPDVRTVIVPAGGGGLLAGIALAVKGIRPDVKVIGVQAAAVPGLHASLAAGRVVTVDPVATIADGIAVARPGEVPFALIRDLVDDVVTVPEALLPGGLLHCLERYKVLVEPAGSAGVAAMLAHPEVFETPAVVVLSGGNVDPLLLSRVLRTGLAAAGRFLQLRLWLPDRPGSLAALVAHLAQERANIVAIEHRRLDPRLDLDEVEVSVQLEMRGPEHCDALVATLAEVGYRIAVE